MIIDAVTVISDIKVGDHLLTAWSGSFYSPTHGDLIGLVRITDITRYIVSFVWLNDSKGSWYSQEGKTDNLDNNSGVRSWKLISGKVLVI